MTRAAQTVTLDKVLIARMIFSAENARAIVDAVDPAQLQSPIIRRLYLLLAQTVVGSTYSPTTIRTSVRDADPTLLDLLDEIVLSDASSHRELTEPIENTIAAFGQWSYATRLQSSLAVASDLGHEGKSARDVRDFLVSELDALDALSLDTRRYDDMPAQYERMMAFARGEGKHGLGFGYTAMDRVVTPLLAGNLAVIGGAPGTGKSTVVRNFIRNWIGMDRRVALMSVEMPGDEQLSNFACMDIGLDYGRYVRQELAEDEITLLGRASRGWVDEGRLTINERISAQPDWLIRQMKRYRADGCDVFVVDHLHHVDYHVINGDMRLPISNFVRALKGFASDYECVVVALSQYSKMSKYDEPDDLHVKESFTIAEVADKMFHVFRPRVAGHLAYDGTFVPDLDSRGRAIMERSPDAPKNAVFDSDPGRVYLKVGKQRVRPVRGIIQLPFNERSGRIYDLHPTPQTSHAA